MNKCIYCGKRTGNKKFCSISCQNKLQGAERADKKYGEIKEFIVKCSKCKKEIVVKEREFLFPKKEKYYCDNKCANSRNHSEETKEKISKSLYKKNKSEFKKIEITCKNCGKNLEVKFWKRHQLFCSRHCVMIWRNLNENIAQKGGLASVVSQSKNKRSKNEIYFAELCKQNFNKVLTNEPMFNGWDADVIIEDVKIAVLWNGKWHYKKIKKEHSVEQVQNRDKIKIKEIEERGYKVYVIKDMGKYKKEFVEEEFNKFLEIVTLLGTDPKF